VTTPQFFATPLSFRRWLVRHHASAPELWVGFYKKGSGRPGLTFPEALDEALCFGWIDGIVRSHGPIRYMHRFTPRKRGSVWSAINTRRARKLIREGRMQPAGRRAFEARDPVKSRLHAVDRRSGAALGRDRETRFRANPAAWTFFQAQPPGYRRTATYWVVSAGREETRERRFTVLVEDSAAGRRIAPLRRTGSGPAR
jgi:uncharacterized protein YdeI (YjbR/CyaY-like superfamily)